VQMARARRRSFFYGDDGNNVDFSQRHAGDMAGQDNTEQVVKAAERNSPQSVQNDPVKSKRLDDGVRDSMAGYDTTPVEDARLKQENPEDAYAGQAENTIKTLRQLTPYFWRLHDPEELAKLKEELIESAMNEDGQKRPQPQPWLKSQRQRDDEFWNSEEPKRVMPRKL
jgi:hypothetical protein